MTNKPTKQMVPLFANPIFKTNTNKLISTSFASSTPSQNVLHQNKALNSKPLSHKKMLELYLKGIKLYNQNLSSFTSNWNNKKLILSLKKSTVSNLDLSLDTSILAPQAPLAGETIAQQEISNTLSSSTTAIDIPVSSPRINKYLKSISLLNSNTKGQVITYSENISYNFKTGNNKLIKNIYTLLEYSFFSMSSLISKPVFEITPEKVVVHLYFFVFKKGTVTSEAKRSRGVNRNNRNLNAPQTQHSSNTFLISNSSKLNKICEILSGYFKKPVELELVRLYYPYFNSNILVNLLGLIINKIKVRFITKKLFKKAIIKNPTKLPRKKRLTIIPSFLSGIKIRIAGRLLTHRVVPRKTVKTIRRGALARGKVNFLDVARFTNKNKRGAFSITISAGQNFS